MPPAPPPFRDRALPWPPILSALKWRIRRNVQVCYPKCRIVLLLFCPSEIKLSAANSTPEVLRTLS
eukprot:scaffold36537_cov161-Skeletonema_dohrnii-CCMP3373.AAC.1